MSRWEHVICLSCWNERQPERAAISMDPPEKLECCYCDEITHHGIFVRDEAVECEHSLTEAETKAFRLEEAIRQHRYDYLSMYASTFDTEGEALAGAASFHRDLWRHIE